MHPWLAPSTITGLKRSLYYLFALRCWEKSPVSMCHSPLQPAGRSSSENWSAVTWPAGNVLGTDSDLKTRAVSSFVEDVGEYLYNVDRMMRQLKRSGKLAKLAGLIVGGFTETRDTTQPFGQTAYEIIRDLVRTNTSIPFAMDFRVSHDKDNVALKVGVGYKLKVGKSKVILEE